MQSLFLNENLSNERIICLNKPYKNLLKLNKHKIIRYLSNYLLTLDKNLNII